jgi:glutamate-ammonia-ligase adenylyltransferase
LWRLQVAGRLLTDRPLDMTAIGEGGRAFMMREAGEPDLEALATRLNRTTSEVAEIVERVLGSAAGT